jgi:peptidoglycan/xylan/chitin deacetylase (PgdA/CDA1 family)
MDDRPALRHAPEGGPGLRPRPRKLALLRWLPDRLVVCRAPAAGQALYLTFDDGPHPDHTAPVLDALARHAAQATFFLIGDQARRFPDLVRRIVAAGHTVGNHSNTHPEFRALPLSRQLAEIDAADAVLRELAGTDDIPFRTPRGALPPRLVAHLAARGRPIVYWSYDSLDYRRPDPALLVSMLAEQPPVAGDIVLMHDDGPAATALLDALLPVWRAQGFVLRALPPGIGRR